ncbi:MAG: bifunctional riboflavin kinase/FAD synthetase [Clostridia bacterium]|nr:bifunctional riboflavin kinase/FAD synthetase [Clostridia bacterium]
MNIYTKVEKLNITSPTSVALGTFDGVHKGHQKVISATLNSGYSPVVFSVNRPYSKQNLRLTTDKARENILENMGVDTFAIISFEEIYNLSPLEFGKDILIKRLNAKHISCGFNFRFGKGAEGNVETLKEICNDFGIELTVCEPIIYEGLPISSSRIRLAIENGRVDEADEMLGLPFTYDFVVEGGDRLGRKLGAPTINQYFPEDFVVPKFGVYAAVVEIDSRKYPAVCNVGIRPTINNGTAPRSETFILDFTGDLYGKNVPVSLIKYLRPETKFEGLDALKDAISNDARVSKQIILERNVL